MTDSTHGVPWSGVPWSTSIPEYLQHPPRPVSPYGQWLNIMDTQLWRRMPPFERIRAIEHMRRLIRDPNPAVPYIPTGVDAKSRPDIGVNGAVDEKFWTDAMNPLFGSGSNALCASAKERDALEEVIVSNATISCSICQDVLKSGSSIYRLPCGHMFHKQEILTWLSTNHTCPNCRYELLTDDPDTNTKILARRGQK
jgi:hypothetical protein